LDTLFREARTYVQRGAYHPLSRTLRIYVNAQSLERPEAAEFINFYLKQDQDLIRRISGIPMTPRAYELVKQRVANKTAGSIFVDGRDVANIELALSASP
jgi:phosphate transport system substrate-binding protein